MTLRIVSWNILQGGGSRVHGIVEALLALNPDVLLLQEYRNGRHAATLQNAFDELELEHRHVPSAPAARNVVAVASRHAFEVHGWAGTSTSADNRTTNTSGIDDALALRLTLSMGGSGEAASSAPTDHRDSGSAKSLMHSRTENPAMTILMAHLPHKKAQRPYFESLLAAPSLLEKSAMIIGDLNCGIPFEDSDTRTFDNTHMFQALLRQGWTDSWRSRQPEAREYTWISPRGNGFRYDHCLCSPELDRQIDDVHYVHEHREAGLSDHSALIVNITL